MVQELDEESTFTRKIEHNSNICSNCYRRLRYILKPHETLPDVVTDQLEYTDTVYFDHFDDDENTGRPSVKQSYCECGFVDSGGKIRPLDRDELMDISLRVRERLSELDIDFDEDDFFDHIREKRNDPSMQFNEEKILEDAVEKSLN